MHLPTSSPRRLTGAAAIAFAAALAPAAALAATSSPAAPQATASAPRCATSGLVVWLNVPPGNGYAGGAGYDLEFTNQSGHACTLRGHPGVSAVSLSGHQFGRPAGWARPGITTVTLANGATATAKLTIEDTASFGSQCFWRAPRPGRPGILPTAAGLRVYPPNQTAAKVIPYPLQACAHNGPVWMDAGPVTPGGPGPGL
jgi:Protein of unknown function (DUF4232)